MWRLWSRWELRLKTGEGKYFQAAGGWPVKDSVRCLKAHEAHLRLTILKALLSCCCVQVHSVWEDVIPLYQPPDTDDMGAWQTARKHGINQLSCDLEGGARTWSRPDVDDEDADLWTARLSYSVHRFFDFCTTCFATGSRSWNSILRQRESKSLSPMWRTTSSRHQQGTAADANAIASWKNRSDVSVSARAPPLWKLNLVSVSVERLEAV